MHTFSLNGWGGLCRRYGRSAARLGALVAFSGAALGIGSRALAAPGDLLFKLYDATPAQFEYFGSSLATVDNFIVGGAPNDATMGTNSGSISVFEAFTGQRLVSLFSPIPEAGGSFGSAIALRAQGGLVTAAVAAPFEDFGAGRAYSMTAGIASRTIRGLFRQPGVYGSYGRSVAVVGDYIAVGAPTYPGPEEDADGTVFIFDGATGAVVSEIHNPRPDAPGSREFGSKLAAIGDYLLVATKKKGSSSEDPGFVYLFHPGGDLLHEFVIPPPFSAGYDFTFSLAALGNNVVIGSPTLLAGTSKVYLFDCDLRSPGFGSLLLTVTGNINGFGSAVGAAKDKIIVGGPTVRVYDGTLRGETATPLLTIPAPPGAGFGLWGESVGGLVNGNIVVTDPVDNDKAPGAGALYVYEGLASPSVKTERRFYLDSDFSDLSFTVEGLKGMKMTFNPKISGTIDATFFEADGEVQAMKLNAADLRAEDFHTTQPFRIDLVNARTVLAPDLGVIGGAAPLQGSSFNLLGNEFVIEGQAEAQIGKQVFSMDGGAGAGSVPADITGFIQQLPLTSGVGGNGQPAFELNVSMEYRRTVAWTEGPFQPVIVGKGTLVGREIPMSPVIPYLLGRADGTTGLDLNGDGIIDIADALWYAIPQ